VAYHVDLGVVPHVGRDLFVPRVVEVRSRGRGRVPINHATSKHWAIFLHGLQHAALLVCRHLLSDRCELSQQILLKTSVRKKWGRGQRVQEKSRECAV
jgi:hypothetical protein